MPLPESTLRRHLNPVFIETGTLYGHGVRAALRCGFHRIFSTEMDQKVGEPVRKRYRTLPTVTVFTDPSDVMLRRVLPDLRVPATFWLDAHPPGDLDFDEPACPLKTELGLIHELSGGYGHTILIDDMRLFGEEGVTRIEFELKMYWPGCVISREDSNLKEVSGDILCCQLPGGVEDQG